MPRQPIRIPSDWGDTPVQLQLWLVEIGDDVDVGDNLAELVVPGLVGDLAAPVAGRIIELQTPSDWGWSAGDTIGWIETASGTV